MTHVKEKSIKISMSNFLPVTREEALSRGWEEPDFVLVTGDAYIDHPSFGAALISRLLQREGYSTGIIPQPDWKDSGALKIFGRPRLGFLITSGNLDSMVAHYTTTGKKRKNDLYSPGGKNGLRPDRALIVYTSLAREAYKNTAVILGGLEASLRRFAHYDCWSNSLRRSVLADSKADLIVYGMGEKAILQTAGRLKKGENIKSVTDIRGTVWRSSMPPEAAGGKKTLFLHSFEDILRDRKKFAENFTAVYDSLTDPESAPAAAEKTGQQYIVQNPPQLPASGDFLDRIYSLPFTRKAHPMYGSREIPALREVEHSITSARGCFGGCSFCSIAYHQGRAVGVRSHESVLAEARTVAASESFKGYIHDAGGPTANFQQPACSIQEKGKHCRRRCLVPVPCSRLKTDHRSYASLLKKIEAVEGVKKVFIRSGIRYDYLMLDRNVKEGRPGNFLEQLCRNHVSGQLRTAPEHASARVLELMGKPGIEVYEKFSSCFRKETKKAGKKQYLLPYFISSHPGSTIEDAIELALYLKKTGFIPDQVQDFYPTPGTLSTCMYYTGLDPFTMKEVYVPSSIEEKKMQKALIHFNRPENHSLVKKALLKAGRADLIGNHRDALIPARPPLNPKKPASG